MPVETEKLMEYHCMFRGRFDPPSGPTIGWYYGESQDDVDEAVSFICDHWGIYGRAYFEEYRNYPDDFRRVVNERPEEMPHPIQCRILGNIALEVGCLDDAQRWIQHGLESCPERATGLRAMLEELLGRVDADSEQADAP
jgi:hypothetical protein